MKSTDFTFIDLFAGIGGFHHALSQIGGRCVLTCEFDPDARRVYEHSFPQPARGGEGSYVFVENIRSLTRKDIDDENSLRSRKAVASRVPDHDVLCGGFPCQPFSKSGEQKGIRDTTRGTLFFDILQIVEAKRPKYLFLENVRNLAGPRHTDTWVTIISSIRELGYRVPSQPLIFSPHLLPRESGGAPQVRERVFILAVRDDLDDTCLDHLVAFNEELQQKRFWNPDKWRISDFLDPDEIVPNVDRYSISDNEATYVEAWDYFARTIDLDRLPGFPLWAFAFAPQPEIKRGMADWEVNFRLKNSDFYNSNTKFIDRWLQRKWGPRKVTVAEFPSSRQKFEWQASKHHPRKPGRTLRDLVLQFRPSGIRVKPPTYLPALVAITQTSVVGPALRGSGATTYRKLTPREAARLQSLPDTVYRTPVVADQVAYKQLGNAVNVGIVRAAAEVLLGLATPSKASVREKQIALFA
jgi:DNA (cytosine-5)-methyltransferase 1